MERLRTKAVLPLSSDIARIVDLCILHYPGGKGAMEDDRNDSITVITDDGGLVFLASIILLDNTFKRCSLCGSYH